MAGARRGFGPPGMEVGFALVKWMACALPVEVANGCLLTA